ncbi:histidine kinase [Nocardioides sp. R-C-SC26]|uniref:sensor histidine kinase n=1 Tax=Nocardioides sp. R-C-SC26 TaxID=2870414 RepID=UPI001E480AF3|nr:histidine kinase [Nocardioides sp. R-C-SC26]
MLLDRAWSRPGPTPEQRRNDVVLAVAAAVVSVLSVELWHSSYGTSLGAGGVEGYAMFALAGLLLSGRRRFPLTILAAESALFIYVGERLGEVGATFTIQMIMFASLYAAWAWSSRPRALLVVTAVVLAAMFGWLFWALLQPDVLVGGSFGLLPADVAQFLYSTAINIAYFGGAIAWGHGAYLSARRLALIAEQQEAERRSVEVEQERALHDERVRIARDLHDVVAHHVSGIGVQAAGAARVIDRDPDASRAALETIGRAARDAVTQMHQLVGLLREGTADGDRAPQPGLGDLVTLTSADIPAVEYRVVGDPFPVPATVGLSIFRIAQEAVSNVRRHGAGAKHASVTLRYLPGTPPEPPPGDAGATTSWVEVEIVDDGRPRGASTGAASGASPSGGFGLRGISERATMHGGVAEIGPRPAGGFRVRVRVPVVSTEVTG